EAHPYTDFVFYGEAGRVHGIDTGEPMAATSFRRAFNDGLKLAGMSEKITPHKLRHTFATQALEATGRVEVVQKLLGHSNPSTTLVYAQVRPNALKEEYRKIFS